MQIRVIQVGLGPIGLAIAQQLVGRRGFALVGAVDVDPAKIGLDVGELVGAGVLPTIEEILRQRVPVVTTTEEAAYPTPRTRRLAAALDEAARQARVAVLGTGVNPGFVMDALPIALTAACERVDRIEVTRVQDASIRRLPFQKKIGAGLSLREFQRRVDAGEVRHVGFAESMRMIADAMGWRIERMTDDVRPRVAEAAVSSDVLAVAPGQVAGIEQRGTAYVGGEPRITLRLEAYIGAPHSYDAVVIEGVPRISSRIEGGVHGDIATASTAVNAIPAIIVAPPGLRTMRDMRLPSFYGGR